MSMKRIITLLFLICCIGLYVQGQSFKLMHKGNALANGDVIQLNETTTNDFGELMFDAEMSVINSSTESKTYTAQLTVNSLTTNGSYQFCFGSCLRPSKIGVETMSHTIDQGVEANQLLEYFPEENSFGNAEAKIKVYENGDETNAVEVNVKFNYADATGIKHLASQPILLLNKNGCYLDIAYLFEESKIRSISCYHITGVFAKKQEIADVEGSIQFVVNRGCYILSVEECGRIGYTYKIIVD